jgi:hypothetical protein
LIEEIDEFSADRPAPVLNIIFGTNWGPTTLHPILVAGPVEPIAAGFDPAMNDAPSFDDDCCTDLPLNFWV